MNRILCYGDSNTWGWNPETMERYPHDTRWTGVLAQVLTGDFCVIEEGLNARTTVWDDPLEPYRNGREYLLPCLISHMPLDVVIILLGTNDLKTRIGVSAYDIADGAGQLVQMVQDSQTGRNQESPEVLLLAPPPVKDVTAFGQRDPAFAGTEMAWAGSIEKSKQFAVQYKRVANAQGCAFFDTATVIETSPIDGIHWEAGAHRVLGQALATEIQQLLTEGT